MDALTFNQHPVRSPIEQIKQGAEQVCLYCTSIYFHSCGCKQLKCFVKKLQLLL